MVSSTFSVVNFTHGANDVGIFSDAYCDDLQLLAVRCSHSRQIVHVQLTQTVNKQLSFLKKCKQKERPFKENVLFQACSPKNPNLGFSMYF